MTRIQKNKAVINTASGALYLYADKILFAQCEFRTKTNAVYAILDRTRICFRRTPLMNDGTRIRGLHFAYRLLHFYVICKLTLYSCKLTLLCVSLQLHADISAIVLCYCKTILILLNLVLLSC